MKRIAIILSISAMVLLMNAGAVFGLEGAEPPPEGMMGITAVQEEPVEESRGGIQPVSQGADTPVSNAEDTAATRSTDPDNIAENE